jgi:hypothetical protein
MDHIAARFQGGFEALKEKMTGTNSVSLDKAIQQLSPNAESAS